MKIALDNPYARTPGRSRWLRGNLHTHTTRSDGVFTPQQAIDAYSARGHDFLGLSDHDRLSDFKGLNPRGMVLLPCNEITANGIHILDAGARVQVAPNRNRQTVINQINKKGGFAIINHPDWQSTFNHCSFEQLEALEGYSGMEIYNGSIVEDEGSPYALGKWDRLLSSGRRIWGFAHDDTHWKNHVGRGFNVVRVPAGKVNAASILKALKAGSFYASTGVILTDIRISGTVLHIESKNATAYEIIGDYGQVAGFVRGRKMSFDTRDLPMTYVRVQAYGRPREFAWTQPFRINGRAEHIARMLNARPVLRTFRVPGRVIPAPDAPAWKKAPAETLHFMGRAAKKPSVRTELRCIAVERHLVFRAICHEPNMSLLKLAASKGSSHLWSDDSLEFFIQGNLKERGYFHLLVNPKGYSHIRHVLDNRNCPKVTCSVEKKADRWIACITVERALLKAAGRLLGFHWARNRKAGVNENHFWKWTGGQNHRPEYFGRLKVRGYEEDANG